MIFEPIVWMMKAIKGKYDTSPGYVLNNINGIKDITGDIPPFFRWWSTNHGRNGRDT